MIYIMKFFATNVVEQSIYQGVYGANSILTATFINTRDKGCQQKHEII